MTEIFKKNFLWALGGAVFFMVLLAAQPVAAFMAGERQNFFIEPSYDYAGRSKVQATLRYVGDRAIFYAEDNWWSGLTAVDLANAKTAIANLLIEFDAIIYPRLTRVYGSEWSPGIDGELRLTILITKLNKGTGGYFNSVDEYPRTQFASSNEREIIYLNADYLTSSSIRVFLAHEFQHMINFYQKEKLRNSVEDVWLNEARSEYAATLSGYDNTFAGSNLERRLKDFLRSPFDSLTEWQNSPADYGVVNLFIQYLANRYGEQILTRSIQSETVGIESINQALAAAGSAERFAGIFTNWLIASYLNDCQQGEGQRYCYLTPALTYERLRVSPLITNILSVAEGAKFSFADSVKDWAGRWYEILPAGSGLNLLLKFQGGDASNFQVPLVLFRSDGTKELRFLKLDRAQSGATVILDFGGRIRQVAVLLSNQTKMAGFLSDETVYPFSYAAEIVSASEPSASPSPLLTPAVSPAPSPAATSTAAIKPNFSDGTLIRAKGDAPVYVVKGKYRRWLQTPQFLMAYPHLGWQNVVEVTPEQLNWHQEAWLIRAEGDYRVYEINGDGTKHWLKMSVEEFLNSGRAWEMVYIVNARERDLYKTGAEVLR